MWKGLNAKRVLYEPVNSVKLVKKMYQKEWNVSDTFLLFLFFPFWSIIDAVYQLPNIQHLSVESSFLTVLLLN